MQLLFLVVSLATVSAHSASTSMFKYRLADSTANGKYSDGSSEYHCFDDVHGVKTFVRGTYGSYGYFEGAVDKIDSNIFHVHWFEISSGTTSFASGAATLSYSNDFQTVSGPYWSTGSNSAAATNGFWFAMAGEQTHDDSTAEGRSDILENCLYPGKSAARQRSQVVTPSINSGLVAKSGMGEVSICPQAEKGMWGGEYIYHHLEENGGAKETGSYAPTSQGFKIAAGMGFVGSWHAKYGAAEGETSGTCLYTVTGDRQGLYLTGFFCLLDGDHVKTDCTAEYYEIAAPSTTGTAHHCGNSSGLLDPPIEAPKPVVQVPAVATQAPQLPVAHAPAPVPQQQRDHAVAEGYRDSTPANNAQRAESPISPVLSAALFTCTSFVFVAAVAYCSYCSFSCQGSKRRRAASASASPRAPISPSRVGSSAQLV